ncbi:hypothetical protein IVB12_08950 [Bradyrhizobium sp. 179]|nr:hypothetical protein [Bradyrhizobium sp. 179]
MPAVEIAVHVIGRDLLFRYKVSIVEEAGVVEGGGTRQQRIALAPSLFQEKMHGLVVIDGIDPADIAVPYREKQSAIAADGVTDFIEDLGPQ